MKTNPIAPAVRFRITTLLGVAALNVFFAAGAWAATDDARVERVAQQQVQLIQPITQQEPPPVSSTESVSPSLTDGTMLDLVVGVQQPLKVGKTLTRIAVGDPAIADVMLTHGNAGGSLLLIAKTPGTTSLLVWTRDRSEPQRYTLRVSNAATRALLGNQSPSVTVAGSTVIIKGSAVNVDAHQRALAAALAAGGTAKSAGKGGAQGGGSVGTIVDQSTVALSSVVQVDVKVVEFSRSVLKEVGINFQKMSNGFNYAIANPGTASNAPPLATAFGLLFQSATHGLSAGISVLEGDGLARVLAEPTLVALSGQSASFLAGGEVPIPVPQALGATAIEYKPYGVGLTVTPTVLASNRIALKVAPEASDLDFVHSVTISGVSVPAITTRRADTTVELGDGESFVIGGLVDRETITNVDKVPFLGDLPVIGAFFKSLNYQQNDKELVIVVTPHLVSPLAKGTVVPLPGGQEQLDGPVWRSYVGGMATGDALPGFSK